MVTTSSSSSIWQMFYDTVSGNPPLQVALTLLVATVFQAILHSSLDRIVERIVRAHNHSSAAEEHKREATLKNVFHAASSIGIWLIAIIVILWQLHVKVAPLLTGAGVIGVVVGLGAQNLIKDCVAGVFIILENQIRVDDIVTLATSTATVSGLVEEVSIRTTRLRDLDGNLHILTNGNIGVITNRSFQFAQVNLDIFVPYDTDIDLIESLINQAGEQTSKTSSLKDDIIEPIVFLRVDNLGETNVTVKALGKVKPGSQWTIAGDYRRNLKKLLVKHKVAAPYQNIVVRQVKNG
jgi:small-conductance mechanosensitive channel